MISPETHAFFFIHGWGGDKESNAVYVSELTKLGHLCVNFDLLGHGVRKEEKDTLNREEFLNQVLVEYDESNELENKKCIVVGSSFGAYLALLLSEKRNVETLILRAPANYPDENFNLSDFRLSSDKEKMLAWRKMILKPGETSSMRALQNFSGDTLIVESENDEMIPHETIENYLYSAEDKKRITHIIMPQTSHRLQNDAQKKEYFDIFYKWLLTK